MKKKLFVLAMIGAIICSLVGCIPEHAEDEALGDENHLTQLLKDLQDPDMKPVYDEEAGHWVAVPVEP